MNKKLKKYMLYFFVNITDDIFTGHRVCSK